MWQIYSLSSLFCGTLEETIDKATMVSHKLVGLLSATWIRNIIFLVITIIGALLIDKELPTLVITRPIILLGILYGINSIFYTVLLKKIEITSSSIITNLIPVIFLPIDIFILGKAFLSRQILGIIALIIGGIIFFLKRRNNKVVRTNRIGLITIVFLFNTLLFGFESYLFKDLFDNMKLSETSFLVNVWGVALVFLSVLILLKYLVLQNRKFQPQILIRYSRGSILSKIADFGNSFFFLKALTLSSTSQVSAMQSFYPIFLVLIVIVTQKKFHINLDEILDRKTLIIKLLGVVIICVGAILSR